MSLSLDLLTGKKVAPLPEIEKSPGEETIWGWRNSAECVEFEMIIRRLDKTGEALGGHSCG